MSAVVVLGRNIGDGTTRVVVHGRDLAYFLEFATGQIRRYGKAEPRVMRALLRVLRNTGQFCRDDEGRALVAPPCTARPGGG